MEVFGGEGLALWEQRCRLEKQVVVLTILKRKDSIEKLDNAN